MPQRQCRESSWTSCTAISPEGPTIRILYIFPHPDDESFGPAPGMARQIREGQDVHLLTLTRGGATRQLHRLGLSVEEMGRVRLGEMREMERVLGLTSLTVLASPDSGLAEMDPREISESDLATGRVALDCYRTYQEVIREADPLRRVGSVLHFELFQESSDPPLPSMTAGL